MDDSPPRTAGALIRRTFRRQRRAVVSSTALITAWQVGEAMVTVLIGLAVDRAVATGQWWQLALWGAALCANFAMLSTAYRFGARIGNRAVQVESHRLRTEVSAHVLDARGARTDRLPGDVLALATGDADEVGEVIRQLTLSLAGLVGLLVSGVVLAVIDPVLAIVVLLGVPAVLTVNQLLAPRLEVRSGRRQEALGAATGMAADLVHGVRPLKGIGATDAALDRYRTTSGRAVHTSAVAAGWQGLLFGVTNAASGIFLAAIALIAGLRTLDGAIGIGELIAVVGLAQFVAEPMRMLSRLIAWIAESRASASRIVEFLATPPLIADGSREPADGHLLELRDVWFDRLKELSLQVKPGSIVALVADDPAVAGAALRLLRGEAVPENGVVQLSGVPLTELPVTAAHERLLVLDHHIDLFEGTLRENVDPLGRLSDEQVVTAMEAAGAADIVATEGLDAAVSAEGRSLSGGQRQRLGLARALAADAGLLVLHDPTTAVDAMTEQQIATALRAHRGGDRSTLLLTSSPPLLAAADVVVHVAAGAVVATGSHDELLDDENYRQAVLR